MKTKEPFNLRQADKSPLEPREGIRWKMKPVVAPLKNDVLTESDGHPVPMAREDSPLISGGAK